MCFVLPKSVEMGRVNGTLHLGFPGSGVETDMSWSHASPILEGRAPKADPIPRLQVDCGLTFDSSLLSSLGLGGQAQL